MKRFISRSRIEKQVYFLLIVQLWFLIVLPIAVLLNFVWWTVYLIPVAILVHGLIIALFEEKICSLSGGSLAYTCGRTFCWYNDYKTSNKRLALAITLYITTLVSALLFTYYILGAGFLKYTLIVLALFYLLAYLFERE